MIIGGLYVDYDSGKDVFNGCIYCFICCILVLLPFEVQRPVSVVPLPGPSSFY